MIASHTIHQYFPYEAARVSGPRTKLDSTYAMKQWHAELSTAADSTPDNKQTFTIIDEGGDIFTVQFWDNSVYLGGTATPEPRRTYYETDENGELHQKND